VCSRAGRAVALSGLTAAAVAGLALVVPMLADYTVYLLNIIMIYAILAMGLNLVMGYAGQISLANGAFFGIGAYVSTLSAVSLGWPYPVALAAAGVVTAGCGVVIGFPALRLSGHYLAMATLAANQAVQLVLTHWHSVTGGMHGVNHPVVDLFGMTLNGNPRMFWLILVVTGLLFWLSRNVVHSPIGRALTALRDSEIAAEVVGVRRSRYKTLAFSLSGFYGGVAGSLYAVVMGYIHPSSFGLLEATNHITMLVLGGMGTLLGPACGAAILVVLPELMTGLAGFRALVTGVLLLLFIVFIPQGLFGLLQQASGWRLSLVGGKLRRAPAKQ
jgi:branched-chain amino acid transport system permease protein